MTNLQYMIWFLATAIATVTVLAVGTLAAADILTKRGRDWDKAVRRSSGGGEPRPQAVGRAPRAQIDGSLGVRAGRDVSPQDLRLVEHHDTAMTKHDEAEAHTIEMADMLSDGMVPQFPDKF